MTMFYVSRETDVVLTSGDYVLVEYLARKSVRHFVGQVNEMKTADGLYNVLFMRKRDKEGYIFGFPEGMDVSWIGADQVVKKLPNPVMHGRGQFKFPEIIKTSD